MKSCLGLLFILLLFTFVVGGGALIWYLSSTAEFARKTTAPAATSAAPPKAVPVNPRSTTPVKPPVAVPARDPGKR